jgi:hypothetical protein
LGAVFERKVKDRINFEGYVRAGKGNSHMHIQIDENSVTLTPFGSLARVSPTNVSRDGDWSWTEMFRWILSESDKRRSDKTPAN